jgi:predicted small secreted protein
MRKNLYVLFAAFVLASLVLAACSSPSGGGSAATDSG